MAKHIIKIIERCEISPPEGSVEPTHVPLSFLDSRWIFTFPMPLFFDLPRPTDYFTLAVVPSLKHSLSAALRRFFPLAAVLVLPSSPQKPHLRFSPGAAGVAFTVAESDADFNGLVDDVPRDAAECRSLVPELPGGDGCEYPLLAIQVTIFPGSGFSIGVTFNHVAADGKAFFHFMKSWAFICRSELTRPLTPVEPEPEPPCHDRGAIVDRHRVEPVFLRNVWARNKLDKTRSLQAPPGTLRATFLVALARVKKLKALATSDDKHATSALRVSSVAVTVAFTWAHLIKSRGPTSTGDETFHLCFLADCRNMVGIEPLVPEARFGNCVVPCFVSARRSQVDDVENGVMYVAREIRKTVRDWRKSPMRATETWNQDFKERIESGNLVTVARSTRLGVYECDFGWGKPRKHVVVHIDMTTTISIAEAGDEGEGFEIGLALNKEDMKTFSSSFQQSLNLLLSS